MKFFKYKESDENLTNILLEDKNEVLLFLENKNIFWEQDIQNFHKLILTEDKDLRAKLISHTTFRTPIAEISKRVSVMYKHSLQFDPEYFSNMYDTAMLDFIEKFDDVFVNSVGGYCYSKAFDMNEYEELFEFKLEDIFIKTTHSFNYDKSENNVLVLENDPVLDKWTIEHFDGRFPYILNLRSVMATNKFEELLNKFSGKKIFVYTTGLDYDQIIDYVNRSIKCGFDEFEWVFNGFENEKKLKEFLNSKNIKYKISNI